MLNNIKLGFASLLCILLSACGGGGDGNISTDSSYSKTIIKNGVTYTCKSDSAANACENNNNCSACDSSNTPTTVITAQCALGSNNVVKVTADGCIAKIGVNIFTNVCQGTTTLRMLTGTGFTQQKVLSEGGAFTTKNGSLEINGTLLSCN
ncbi:hypothetical protein NDN13_13205 [Acinetobacter sp. C32I]|uniref:hypothetical protein n=1 Tax=Acinetobacter sp. C32I TaxID=2950074 RepID=UPI00203692F1|nr:hypothetical protein [Acinetobacter sp. C32I]USA52422.1 hypothetical protein NDN13_13205 [Acinetobacter sp. C32I]